MEGSPGLALAQPFAGGVLASQDAAAASRGQQQPLLVEEARRILNPAQPLNDYDVQLQSSPALSNGARTFAELTTAPFQKDAYAADPSAFQRDPVCIGPYLLDEPYAPGAGEIRLVRNDAYYGANTGFTQRWRCRSVSCRPMTWPQAPRRSPPISRPTRARRRTSWDCNPAGTAGAPNPT